MEKDAPRVLEYFGSDFIDRTFKRTFYPFLSRLRECYKSENASSFLSQ